MSSRPSPRHPLALAAIGAALAALLLTVAGCGNGEADNAAGTSGGGHIAGPTQRANGKAGTPAASGSAGAPTMHPTPSATPAVLELDAEVHGDTVTPLPGTRAVRLGQRVRIVVTAPGTSDEVHVHGYDLHGDLSDGKATVEFTADVPGAFEVELEKASLLLFRLQVS